MLISTCISYLPFKVSIASYLGNLAYSDRDMPYPICFGSGVLDADLAEEYGFSKRCHYLISELATGDMTQLFEDARAHGPDLREWAHQRFPLLFAAEGVLTLKQWRNEMAFHAFNCLQQLHADGFTHLDCHLGNFMVLNSGKMVIHDFGTTEDATAENVADDFEMFKEHWNNWIKLDTLEKRVESSTRVAGIA